MSRPSREDVERVLADLADAPMDLPVDNDTVDAVVTIPVIYQGKVIGRATEPAEDYRPAMVRDQHRRISELRRALSEGDDPYWIAWVALEVGAGTALPALLRRAPRKRDAQEGGKGKKGTKKESRRAQHAAFLKTLKQTKAPTFNDRVTRARANTTIPHTTAVRWAREAGFE